MNISRPSEGPRRFSNYSDAHPCLNFCVIFFRPGDGSEKAPRKAFTFKNFGEEIASTDYSIVYQIAGSAISQVLITPSLKKKIAFCRFLSMTS
jgi:hypothetical protein